MQKLVVAATLTIGAALLAGGLVQVYYSGLPPASAWSAPAMYSFLGVIFCLSGCGYSRGASSENYPKWLSCAMSAYDPKRILDPLRLLLG